MDGDGSFYFYCWRRKASGRHYSPFYEVIPLSAACERGERGEEEWARARNEFSQLSKGFSVDSFRLYTLSTTY